MNDLMPVGDSTHTCLCPVCMHGTLVMRRSPSTGLLNNSDFCLLCGQAFWYTDVVDGALAPTPVNA